MKDQIIETLKECLTEGKYPEAEQAYKDLYKLGSNEALEGTRIMMKHFDGRLTSTIESGVIKGFSAELNEECEKITIRLTELTITLNQLKKNK